VIAIALRLRMLDLFIKVSENFINDNSVGDASNYRHIVFLMHFLQLLLAILNTLFIHLTQLILFT
jgi:hypothetical protein